MRFLFAALVGCCLYLAASVEAGKFMEKPGFHWEARPRLGHFAELPFTDLYLNYAAAFVKPLHPDRSKDDFRNYVPSADECMVFFTEYRSNSYQLFDVDQVIVLDACLGYLYGSTYHEKDRESEYVSENLDALIADQKLKALYDGTRVNDLNEGAKDCIGDLLLNSIRAKNQFSKEKCNSDWIELFNTFAQCHTSIPEESRTSDTYVKLIYDLVRARGKECFDDEITKLNQAVRSTYANSLHDRVGNKIKKFFSAKADQADTRIWPKQIMKVLTTVQNDQVVDLRRIAILLRGVYKKEEQLTTKFLQNLSAKATEELSAIAKEDSTRGLTTYKNWVDGLCNFFRSSDNDNWYDYTVPFRRMTKMLEYQEIYGITREYFIEKVLTGGYETAPLYLTVSSCNVLTFTQGLLNSYPHNHALSYTVSLKADRSKMVIWPDLGFY